MRGLLFTAVIVFFLCVLTFYYRQSLTDPLLPAPAADQYSSAIDKAKRVSQLHGSAERQRWAAELQVASAQTTDRQFAVDGANAEILVITSGSLNASDCSVIAKSETGASAANIGFEKLSCQNSSNRSSYQETLGSRK